MTIKIGKNEYPYYFLGHEFNEATIKYVNRILKTASQPRDDKGRFKKAG